MKPYSVMQQLYAVGVWEWWPLCEMNCVTAAFRIDVVVRRCAVLPTVAPQSQACATVALSVAPEWVVYAVVCIGFSERDDAAVVFRYLFTFSTRHYSQSLHMCPLFILSHTQFLYSSIIWHYSVVRTGINSVTLYVGCPWNCSLFS